MRRRILLAIGATLLAMLALIWFATRATLLAGLERMEESTMRENVERVRSALDRDLSALATTANDWAAWDATYDFLSELDPTYVEEHLRDATLANLDVDLMVFADPDGRLVHIRSLARLPSNLDALFAQYPALRGSAEEGGSVQGVAVLEDCTWLLASHPILTNEHEGPSRGTLVLGRRLDEEEIDGLSARVRLDLSVEVPASLPAGDPILSALARLSVAVPVLVEHSAPDRLAAYATLRDLNGEETLALAVGTPSEIRRQAMQITASSMLWIAATGVVFGAVVLGFLEQRVLARLHSLSAQVLSIKTGSRPAVRLEIEGTDQIAYLAAAINGMLAALETSTQDLQASERRAQAFLEAVPDLILFVTAEDRIRDIRLPRGWSVGGLSEAIRGMRIEGTKDLFAAVGARDRERLESSARAARETQVPQLVDLDLLVEGVARSFEVRLAATPSNETLFVIRDVTAHRQAVEAERKEILLREIHHRVRNNLQLISSLLGLQAGSTDDPRVKAILAESQDRIRSMALVHERLTQSTRVGGLGYAAYILDLVEHLTRSYAGAYGKVEIVTQLEDVDLPDDAALPVGLITNELVTNALRHAFPGNRRGRIVVSLGPGTGSEPTAVICIEDDGVGLPPTVDPSNSATLGFRIVAALVRQVRGTMQATCGAGTRFRLTLPRG